MSSQGNRGLRLLSVGELPPSSTMSMKHANIVTVYRWWRNSGVVVIAYLEGNPLPHAAISRPTRNAATVYHL